MITLDDLQSSVSVSHDLARHFDFDTGRAASDNSWIKLAPQQAFTVLAGDSSGGVFLAYGDGEIEQRPILYASSEGQAGSLAPNLTALLAMMMALPGWQDVLKFSSNGNLKEMRRTARLLEQDGPDDEQLLAATQRLMRELAIPVLADPVSLLHDCVHAGDCNVVAEDGQRYEPLFGLFTSHDNPFWKGMTS
ncbi:hypothetical protein [Janthinobacterium sp. RB2R34]|uniref:hypothetical protein n=1 Tax=Janthinobacterium sp. RB2R34 TaxID=3424193 RepID=UPI003F24AC52